MTSVAVSQQEQRRAVTEAKMADVGTDLSTLSEAQFEDGLSRLKLVQERIQKLIGTALAKDIHYGDPNGAFKRKILFKSGAQELRRIMRLRLVTISREVTQQEDYVSVVVEVQAIDAMGRAVAQAIGACNSREKRFRKRGSTDWTYTDPRETLHDCLAMAEKRAGVAATLEASGATGFFADKDAIGAIEEAEWEERAEWSQEQRAEFIRVARERGMNADDMKAFVKDRCEGRTAVFADEVADLMDGLSRWKPRPTVEGETATKGSEPPPPPVSGFDSEDGQ